MTLRCQTLGGRLFLLILFAMAFTLGGVRLAEISGGGGAMIAVGIAAAFVLATFTGRWVARPFETIISSLREGVANLQRSQTHLDDAYVQFLETMAQALDARDPYTAGHSLRVAAYSFAIAGELGLPKKDCETIRTAAQLHDIGKIGIPDVILQKVGRLTPEEYGLIKLHPQIGRKILEKVSRFKDLLPAVELHHENFDGTGYPYKLSGTRIPLEARIVRVADAFDSMASSRSYREALPLATAIDELVKYSGSQFDPQVMQAFLNLIARGKPETLLNENEGLIPRLTMVKVFRTA
ncbi:MAG: HD-GYP domain-containing protein [Bryobacteraceae bacterium]|jgi:putative nucleotidyltransferase with HDIG domain